MTKDFKLYRGDDEEPRDIYRRIMAVDRDRLSRTNARTAWVAAGIALAVAALIGGSALIKQRLDRDAAPKHRASARKAEIREPPLVSVDTQIALPQNVQNIIDNLDDSGGGLQYQRSAVQDQIGEEH